jgi:hypothetical protein
LKQKLRYTKTGYFSKWPAFFIICAIFLSGCEKDERFEGEIHFEVKIKNDPTGKMKSLAPQFYHFKIKRNRIIFTTEGGLSSTLFGGMIFDGQKDEGYMLMKSSQLAYRMAKGSDTKMAEKAEAITTEIKVTKEKMDVLGYPCEKYIIKSTEEGETTESEVWVTKNIKVEFPKSLQESSPDMFFGSFEGFPLKITSFSKSGREVEVIATEVLESSISSSSFDIPDNYKVTDDDPSEMINMFRQFLK